MDGLLFARKGLCPCSRGRPLPRQEQTTRTGVQPLSDSMEDSMRPRLVVTMEWLMQRVQVRDNGCWQWTGAKSEKGYGIITTTSLKPPRRHRRAHRIIWELVHSAIPDGMQVLHTCDNPGCINPAHLFLGTNADNMRDKVSKGRGTPPPHFYGENHPKHKLTWASVDSMRSLAQTGQSLTSLSRQFGISLPVVSKIVRGELWINR